MKTLSLTILVAGLMAGQIATADTVFYGKQDDQRLQDLHNQKHLEAINPTLPAQPLTTQNTQEAQENGTLSLSSDELHQYPDLVARATAMAVLQHNVENVVFLLPYYQKIPDHMRETIIEEWAKGIIAERQGDTKSAVNAYRIALSENADAGMLRLRLAMALYANKDYEASEHQFTKLLSDTQLPNQIAEVIQDYLVAIKKQDRWTVNAGTYFINDKNINNAPKNTNLGGGWRAPEPQSAQGIGLNLNIGKKKSLVDGYFAQTSLNTSGKYHWDNQRYNELTVRLSAGVGHQDAKHTFSLLPFVEKSYYAGDNPEHDLGYFSTSKGLSAEWSYWLNRQWQANLYGEVAEQDYRTRNHLDGLSRTAGVSALYIHNPKQYWFAGMDFGRVDTRDDEDAYTRRSIRAGVGQELGYGFGTRLNASYAEKDYRGVGFFGKIQHNQEYSVGASIWNKKVHYAGITPRVTWQYQKVDSNLPLYEYDKNKVFVEMSKQF